VRGICPIPLEPARGKRDRREIFVFQSPKNGRTVTVADLVNFCQALMLEFDPRWRCMLRGRVESR
jgi:hypothetical protein